MPPTKSTTPKALRKPRAATVRSAPRKASAKKEHAPAVHHKPELPTEGPGLVFQAPEEEKPAVRHAHKYIFATGRRKTAVANVRLFTGEGKTLVNQKPLEQYFQYSFYQQIVGQPFHLTGLGKNYHFVAHINGGGANAQAEALRHGISIALSSTSDEVRKVLKKNGLLTRDDRKKERKKPGLKRARRAPQWAKR